MCSFVIKIAILVSKAALDDLTIPALGFNIANVLELIADPDLKKILLYLIILCFYSNFHITFHNIHYQF